MKVAIVCDWLTNVGGAEKLLLEIHKMFPKAPIYTSKYNKKGIDWFNDAEVHTGWLKIFPVCLRRFLSPLRASYFKHLDLSNYDLVISVTGAEAKGVKVHGKKHSAVHLCYCHVPTQYYWAMYDDYVKNPGFGFLNPIVRFFFKLFVKPLRKSDYKAAQRPDYYITISKYAKEEIKKYYHRDAVVINPPVEIEDFDYKGKKKEGIEDSFITTSRQVNWKRLDLCIEGCLKANQKLIVVGEGPEHKNLVKLANSSPLIEFRPLMKKSELASYLRGAKGYIFPSMEPFGIAPVEALAAGCPVIAFNKGGAKDYIIDGINGVFFNTQNGDAVAKAIRDFEEKKFKKDEIAKSAEKFSQARFIKELSTFVEEKTNAKIR